jgi:hypothetical protein
VFDGSAVHIDMRHTDLQGLSRGLNEFYGLQKEKRLELNGARYRMAQERARTQAVRASGLRRALSIV